MPKTKTPNIPSSIGKKAGENSGHYGFPPHFFLFVRACWGIAFGASDAKFYTERGVLRKHSHSYVIEAQQSAVQNLASAARRVNPQQALKKGLLIPFLSFTLLLQAQSDSLSIEREMLLESLAEEGQWNIEALEWESYLQQLRRRPLSLNKAGYEDFERLGFLSPNQIASLLTYREKAGPFFSKYELQAVPGLDTATIRLLWPFVQLAGHLDDFHVGLGKMMRQGSHQLFVRWSRRNLPFTGRNRFPGQEGNVDQCYTRWRYTYSNRLSIGITAEKDAGEAFFRESNPHGFDFYSAHLVLNNYNRWIRTIAIGDFQLNLGQGLITHGGFGGRKSAQVMQLKKSGPVLRRYSSVDENRFFRGVGLTLAPADGWQISGWYARNRRDANLSQPDSLSPPSFTALQNSGLHRKPSEIEDEDGVGLTSLGGSLSFSQPRLKVGLHYLRQQFDRSWIPREQVYNRFYFRGQQWQNTSLDYHYLWANLHFFGEVARSRNGAIATLNGLIISMDKHLTVGLLHRHLPPHYQALDPNIFAETSRGSNETGFYSSVECRPSNRWLIAAYWDRYRHPWPRYQADGPQRGQEGRLRITYREKRKLEAYLEARQEWKYGQSGEDPFRQKLTQLRLHSSYRLSKGLELRSRINLGWFQTADSRQQGIQLHQDVIFKPLGYPWHFTGRIALFDTDSYDVRFYNYENNLLHQQSIPAYYKRGIRYYLNVRYRGIRDLVLECRLARSVEWAREAAPAPWQCSAQIKFQF